MSRPPFIPTALEPGALDRALRVLERSGAVKEDLPKIAATIVAKEYPNAKVEGHLIGIRDACANLVIRFEEIRAYHGLEDEGEE